MTTNIIVIMCSLIKVIYHLSALHGQDFVLVLDDGCYDLDCFHWVKDKDILSGGSMSICHKIRVKYLNFVTE